MSMPRTTHQWLKPFFDAIEGKGTRQPQIGSPSGTVGIYGITGIAQIASGTAGISGFTGLAAGASGPATWWFNGGSGAFYTIGDLVTALKNVGVLKR